MSAKREKEQEKEDEGRKLEELLKDPCRWRAAGDVLRSKLRIAEDLSREHVQELLGVSQSGVSRLLAGNPPKKLPVKGLNDLLGRLGLTVEDLEKLAHAVGGPLLCIDRPEEGFDSTECASIHFHAEGDHAVAFPTDPRTTSEQEYCRMCGGPLSAECPECQRPVVAASHCPRCGHCYVGGVPEELRGLTGKRLVQACEKRNAANRAAMQHAEGGLRT